MPLDNTIATKPLLDKIYAKEYHNPEEYTFPVKWADYCTSTITIDGVEHTVENKESRQLINTRDMCVVGEHKSKYVEQLHEPIVNKVLEVAEKLHIGKVIPNIRVYENGRKLRGEVYFPEQSFDVRSGLNDTVCFKMEFYNSYCGNWKLGIKALAMRLICLNGMLYGQAITGSVLKHTANTNYNSLLENTKHSSEIFMKSEDIYNKMLLSGHTKTQAMQMFRKYLCTDIVNGQRKVNETQVNILARLLRDYRKELGHNAWATYNAMTEWATHTPASQDKNAYRNESPVARINDSNKRHGKVTNLLKQWTI